MATTKLVTANDLLQMPDDGRRYELIAGELREVSPGSVQHSDIGSEILTRMRLFARSHGLGLVLGPDAGFFFGHEPDTVRAPDVSFIRADRVPSKEQRQGFADVVPDLAVEVASPNDSRPEVLEKVAFYLQQGVPLVWTVWPKSRSVLAHRAAQEPRTFREGDILDGEDVLPGFRIPVEELFRDA